ALVDLDRLFDPEAPLVSEDGCGRQVLNADLLRLPHLPLDDNWEPSGVDAEPLLQQLLTFLTEPDDDWEHAFRARAAQRDHAGTAQVLAHLQAFAPEGLH